MNPYIIINILNWNQANTTIECLRSVMDIDYDNFDIVVIDNGSTDNSVPLIRKTFPQVYLLENKENLGCSEGRNSGIFFSLQRDPDFVFLLDNDTIVDKKIIDECLKIAGSDPNIGVVVPVIYYYDKKDVVWMAGAMIDWNRGLFYDTKRGEVDRGQLITRDIDTAPEGFCFVRKDVFEKAGFFDPRFFFYYEGGDWTTRIKKKGFRIVCLPSAKIWHKVGFSLGNESARFYYYRTRNRLLFMSTSALRISLFIFTFYFLYDFFYRTLITLFWSGQRKQIIAALDGLFDFLRGRFGYKAINE